MSRTPYFERKKKEIEADPWKLQNAPLDIKGNKEIVMKAVSTCGRLLFYASDRLKGDKDVVLAALKNNVFACEYMSVNLWGDEDIGNLLLADYAERSESSEYV